MNRFVIAVVLALPALALAEDRLPSPDYHRQPSDPAWLAQVVQLHGHLGPAVVAGARMGMIGRDAVGAKGYFDVQVTCDGPLAQPPQACFLDGIQAATGATIGKRTLLWTQANKLVVRVKNIRTGKTVELHPAPALLDLLASFKPEAKAETAHGPGQQDHERLEEIARKIAVMPEKEVAAVTVIKGRIATPSSPGPEVRMVQCRPDPYGSPRPAQGATNVPLRTSMYFELELNNAKAEDRILPDSVTMSVQPTGGQSVDFLLLNRRFVQGARGWLRPIASQGGSLAVYIDPGIELRPSTLYTVHVRARSREGAELSVKGGAWGFTTEAAAEEHAINLSLDLGKEPVRWHGGFFTGICNVVFCTQDRSFGPTYRMMSEAHAQHPRAWRYQRDIWMTATDDRKPDWAMMMDPLVPNFVRERETRRIAAIETRANGTVLHLEDFVGCQQYGVRTHRSLSQDYARGFEILVADGVSDARSQVLAVDDAARTILIAAIPTPKPGWHLDYQALPSQKENPDAPGFFAAGGTHLRRCDPPGTPVYYWGRLDKEWDLAHVTHGRRLVVNFVDAPSDLSLTARRYTRPKDYAEWHEVVRTVTGHLIDRYGEGAMDFAWSVFNEPDIVGDYWRFHWDEAQRFYDYTVDAVLRAFEDRGRDSSRVRVGGLELGAIFGPNLRLDEFLAHCSPRAEAKGALPQNAAFADPRLDGKRSRRLEQLCREHHGKGCPCDFISIHTYNRSDVAATKLIRAKQMALEADPEFYRDLWIDSHESCPSWAPPPDDAASDSYLGNGYFPTWCLDVVHRQLQKANDDARYACGESVVTIWPPPVGFAGVNAISRLLPVNDEHAGRSDRTATVPTPIFHALGLLSDFGPSYWVMPSQRCGGHVLGGFASRDPQGTVRLALFSHFSDDIQSRSDQTFKVTLDLANTGDDGTARVTEYRFDRQHNSYFSQAVALRDCPATRSTEIEALIRTMEDGDRAALHKALQRIQKLDRASLAAIAPALLQRATNLTDRELREEVQGVMRGIFAANTAQPGYPRAKVEEIQKLAELRPTKVKDLTRGPNGSLRLTALISGNGANILVIEPARTSDRSPKPGL